MKTTKDILLRDILPPNLRSDSVVAKVAEAVDPHLNLIASMVRLAYVYSRIDELTGEQLDPFGRAVSCSCLEQPVEQRKEACGH